MTSTQPLVRRSFQTRLALAYATNFYAAGVFVLVCAVIPLTGVDATTSGDDPAPTTITVGGFGLGPERLVLGSSIALVLLLPVAIALGWVVAGRFLRPLRAMSAAAKVISAGNLDQRLDLGEPADELTELGHTLDGLFGRLQASFDAQRHFVANASHELRTPLAGLRTVLEVALADPEADAASLREVCRQALALGEHQERLVTALLALAISERGAARWDTLDLAEIADRVLDPRGAEAADPRGAEAADPQGGAAVGPGGGEAAEPRGAEAPDPGGGEAAEPSAGHAVEGGVTFARDLRPARTEGDPKLVESLIANLVDNAVRHNHPGGHVTVTTESSSLGAQVTVANSGPSIADDQIERLLQPFQRLATGRDKRHEGYGLGLAIVNAVARAHHADLSIRARSEGGLTITVRFAPPKAVSEGRDQGHGRTWPPGALP